MRQKLWPVAYGGDVRVPRDIGRCAGIVAILVPLIAAHFVNAQPLTASGPLVPLARLATVMFLLGVLLLATALGAALLER